MRKIIAYVIGWALALMPAIAWAQQQPIPVYAANGQPVVFTVQALGGGAGNTTLQVQYADYSMFNELEIRYYSTLNLGAFIPQVCSLVDTYIGVSQGVATDWSATNTLGTPSAYKQVVSEGNPPTLKRYRVSGAMGPLTISVRATALAGKSCTVHAEVRGVVFPSSGAAVGEVLDGTTVAFTDIRPVVVGGVNPDTLLLKTLSVDDTGALKTAGGSSAISYAAGVPTAVTLSASTSACACGLTEGTDYEFSCSVPAAWRHGAATPTALLTDNPLPAGAIRSPMRMPTGSTCFCFISGSAGSCTVSVIPTS